MAEEPISKSTQISQSNKTDKSEANSTKPNKRVRFAEMDSTQNQNFTSKRLRHRVSLELGPPLRVESISPRIITEKKTLNIIPYYQSTKTESKPKSASYSSPSLQQQKDLEIAFHREKKVQINKGIEKEKNSENSLRELPLKIEKISLQKHPSKTASFVPQPKTILKPALKISSANNSDSHSKPEVKLKSDGIGRKEAEKEKGTEERNENTTGLCEIGEKTPIKKVATFQTPLTSRPKRSFDKKNLIERNRKIPQKLFSEENGQKPSEKVEISPKKKKKSSKSDLNHLRSIRSDLIRIEKDTENRLRFVFVIRGHLYHIKKQIGRGGYSNVYKAVNSTRKFAIKHIVIKDQSVVTNFRREIELLEKLRGESTIVRLIEYEKDEENCQLFMVFQLADGDMAEYLKRNVPLDIYSTRYFWGQMVDAVRVLHEYRIVHKDLKPQNFVLIDAHVKLIDFGLADTVSDKTTHIYGDKMEGTPNYMAPESFGQTNGKIAVCRGTDVWSLGIILFEMVVGHTPFHNLKGFAKCSAIANGAKMPLELIKDPLVLDLVRKCLKKNPTERPSVEDIQNHPLLAICRRNCAKKSIFD